MARVAVPADAETLAIGLLAGGLAADPVFAGVGVLGVAATDSPGFEAPPEFVQVRKTGGARPTLVSDRAQLTLTAYAEGHGPADELRAHEIIVRCGALLDAAANAGWLGPAPLKGVDALASPYLDPEPASGRARYSATYSVHVRGYVADIPTGS